MKGSKIQQMVDGAVRTIEFYKITTRAVIGWEACLHESM